MFDRVCCVAFDAVGTLIYPDPPVVEVYARVGKKYGSKLTIPKVQGKFRDAFQAEYQGESRTSEEFERLRWRRIVQRVFQLEDIEPCFEDLFTHFGRAESWRCFSEVAETTSRLSKRGFDLVVASNFDQRLHAICDGHAELASFSSRIISSEVGSFKPYPAFFQGLLEQTGYLRHEVLLVGDDWLNDVCGALEFGMPAVFLDRSQTEPLTRRDNVFVISSLLGLLDLLP